MPLTQKPLSTINTMVITDKPAKNIPMSWTIHGLQSITLFLHLKREHVFLKNKHDDVKPV